MDALVLNLYTGDGSKLIYNTGDGPTSIDNTLLS